MRLALDVSNNNPIGLAELRRSGAELLIAKASEGSTFTDQTYHDHRTIAHGAGVRFGSYLYLHALAAGDEAALFLRDAQPLPGEVVAIDAEQGGQDGATVAAMARRASSCAAQLELVGLHPWLYASSSYWLQLAAEAPTLKRLPVWEAQYPRRLARWSPQLARLRVRLRHGATVVCWQWTDRYPVGDRRFDASRLFVPVAKLPT